MAPEPVVVPPGWRPDAVFILGMLPRTGTNHLADLFELHRDVAVLKPVFEDHLVRFSPLLTTYVEEVTSRWSPEWGVPAEEGPSLLRHIGDGVVRWMAGHAPGRTMVTKMPRVDNVERFFDLFPGCGLVLLLRDGRSVVESGVRSFGWSYEFGFRTWNAAARTVADFCAAHEGDPRLQVVRYEELIDDERTVMSRVFAAFGLDPDGFSPEAVDALPVRGSSTLTETGTLHWQPVERSAGFDPRERWRSWDAQRHRRFNAVAGASQRRLGYPTEPVAGRGSPAEMLSSGIEALRAGSRDVGQQVSRMRRVVGRIWW